MGIQVDFDLKDILNQLNQKLEKIDDRLKKVEESQIRMESDIDKTKEDIREIKGSQKAQIWTLIGILITAVGGFIVPVGRSVLSFNP